MVVLFQGDPRIFISKQGTTMIFQSGQPIMDGGIENAVVISLFTREGWAGNTLFGDVSKHIGSRYEISHDQPITVSALNDIRDAAEKALVWMVKSNLVESVSVTVTNPTGNDINTSIIIAPPGTDEQVLLVNKHGNNWIIQKLEPASGRV